MNVFHHASSKTDCRFKWVSSIISYVLTLFTPEPRFIGVRRQISLPSPIRSGSSLRSLVLLFYFKPQIWPTNLVSGLARLGFVLLSFELIQLFKLSLIYQLELIPLSLPLCRVLELEDHPSEPIFIVICSA